jgi:hypothetical protein
MPHFLPSRLRRALGLIKSDGFALNLGLRKPYEPEASIKLSAFHGRRALIFTFN